MAEDAVVVTDARNEYNILRAAPVISIAVFAWVFLLHLSPDFYHTFPSPLDLSMWRIISVIVLLAMVGLEARSFSGAVGAPDETAMEAQTKKKKAQVDYPPKISGVIYADTYVPIDGETDVKVRTMLARACKLCDKEAECWGKVGSKISSADFNANMECKEGLREMGAL